MTYKQLVDSLRATKLQQTLDKIEFYGRDGHFNTDDKGTILPPADFHWTPESNHPSGSWFGAKLVGKNFRNLLETHPVYIDPDSSLAGGVMVLMGQYRRPGWNPDIGIPEDLVRRNKLYDLVCPIGGAQHFHHAVDEIGFKLGWKGILEKIRHYQDIHKGDPDKLEFLKAEEDVVLGVQDWILRNARAAELTAKDEKDPERKANLERMAAMNYKLVNDPPETFLEACQWLAWFIMESLMFNGSGAGGALDLILKPYYDADIAAGRLTWEEAVYHLACLLIKDNSYYEIGGPNPDGSDRTNGISWAVLEASHWLKIPNAICLRIHEYSDPAFIKKAVEYLFDDKHGAPSFIGDKKLNEGMVRLGYPVELARRRYKTGCHWTALPGIEYTLNDVVKINFAKVFEVAYREMLDESSQPHSVARLWEIFHKHMRLAVEAIAEGNDYHLEHMWKSSPELAMDFMCHGPVEKGRDISQFGTVAYYNMCVDGAGLGVAADSFATLLQRVEQEERFTWEQMDAMLKCNFENYEPERMLLKSTPRYGSGGTAADQYALDIVKMFSDEVIEMAAKKPYKMVPGLFSWANTIPMGRAVGATPNGRLAGTPITHGANPEPGFKESGALTAMANAVASVQPGWGNSAPIQLEIDPILGRDEGGIENISSFLTTYCNDLGGTLVNINILDKEKILDAHAHPEQHPDLVVRVTGFSSYFNALSKDFRQLVVDRIIQG